MYPRSVSVTEAWLHDLHGFCLGHRLLVFLVGGAWEAGSEAALVGLDFAQ